MEIDQLRDNLNHVRERISQAATRSGRSAHDIGLVAVTKTHPAETVAQLAQLGVTDVGESRVQDALPKLSALQDRGLTWHFIGHLQTNKAKQVVGAFSLLHSVDSLRLARAVGERAVQQEIVQPVLLEVNVSGEAAKHGFSPKDVTALLEQLAKVEGIEIQGLMTMAPYEEDPERARPVFARLRELAEDLRAGSDLRLSHLSMGMTNDFEVAVEEGATLVRVGTAILGERDQA